MAVAYFAAVVHSGAAASASAVDYDATDVIAVGTGASLSSSLLLLAAVVVASRGRTASVSAPTEWLTASRYFIRELSSLGR